MVWQHISVQIRLGRIQMRYSDVKRHLQPYVMVTKRKTTINHAFASAVAPCDEYDSQRIRSAIVDLGQDPDLELDCVYCGKPAETWDHVFATVKKSVFSGHGHRMGNLLPCCKPCNSKKGNRSWQAYLSTLLIPDADRESRQGLIASYLEKHHVLDDLPAVHCDYEELGRIRSQVLALLAEGDVIAARIRRRNAA